MTGFDLLQYEDRVVRPLRRLHGPLAPENLLERYAVSVEMSTAEVEEHLKEVRAFWHAIAKGPDRRALVGSRLLTADRELIAAGVFRSGPAGWQAAASLIAPRAAAPVRDSPLPTIMPTAEPALSDDRPTRIDERTTKADPAAGAASRPAEKPTDSGIVRSQGSRAWAESWDVDLAGLTVIDSDDGVNLTFETVSTWEDGGRIAISWIPPEVGDVRILRFTGEVPWESGDLVPLDRLERKGDEVHGTPQKGGIRTTLEADVPVGYFIYVPVVAVGAMATVGRGVGYSVADRVRDLRAQRAGDRVVLSWLWPGEARLADVLVHDSSGIEHRWRVTRADYDDGSGFALPVAVAGGTADVYAVTAGPGTRSRAVRVEIPSVPPRLGYTLRGVGAPGRRRWVVTLNPIDPCVRVNVVVVALARAMPAHSEHGVTIANQIGLSMNPGSPYRFEFQLPKELSGERSLWVRCFATEASMIDPPAHTLRIR